MAYDGEYDRLWKNGRIWEGICLGQKKKMALAAAGGAGGGGGQRCDLGAGTLLHRRWPAVSQK